MKNDRLQVCTLGLAVLLGGKSLDVHLRLEIIQSEASRDRFIETLKCQRNRANLVNLISSMPEEKYTSKTQLFNQKKNAKLCKERQMKCWRK